MTTLIATIDEAIEYLKKHKEKGFKYVLVSDDPAGELRAPSKRKKYYTISLGLARDIFEKDDLRNLFEARVLLMLLYKEDGLKLFSEDVRSYYKSNKGSEGNEEKKPHARGIRLSLIHI